MDAIATQLGVSQQTISNDLANLPITGKSKSAKTATNPKGAGRPKGHFEKAAKERQREHGKTAPGRKTLQQKSAGVFPS